MNQKRLIIFMPSIEGGGVEKNLFIISRFLVKKIKDISLITVSNSYRKKFDKKIRFISPKNTFWDSVGRRKKFFISLFMLFFEILKNTKGNIICLLDSDDYFHKNKIKKILEVFQKNQNINFVQNLPYIKGKRKLKKKNKNNPMSFWPYLAPESCISFRKKFMKDFLKINRRYLNKFENVWMGFRMGVYSFFNQRSFCTLSENLTFYESLGESRKYQFLGKNWIKRRNDSFDYLKKILKGSMSLKYNFDYLITKFLAGFYR